MEKSFILRLSLRSLYRCELTGPNGEKLYTQPVRMVLPAAPEVFEIVDEPVDFEGEIGDIATFTVNATGVTGYQWQYSFNGTDWNVTGVTGNKTATITVEITENRLRSLYRCELTGPNGEKLYTQPVRMVLPVGRKALYPACPDGFACS